MFHSRAHKPSNKTRFMTNEHAQSPNTKWFVKDVLVQLGCEHKSGTAV